MQKPAGVSGFSATTSQLVLSDANKNENVVAFQFQPLELNISTNNPSYTLQFDVPSDTIGAAAWAKAVDVKLPADSVEKTFTGSDLNSLLINRLKLPTGVASKVVVRLKTEIIQSSGAPSTIPPLYSKVEMVVTPYLVEIVYPALLVRGGNSWVTPASRTDGFVLTSRNFDHKYEGYIYLPNADGWNGDAFTLQSTTDGKSYGWGTDANTMSVGGGNLWLTPAPAYMKVNADVQALTITYTPVQFYISGDDNSWSTSATPMTYDQATKKWVAENVALTPGSKFAFTANDGWNIAYKLDDKDNLVFAGNPVWGGINITVPQKTGTYKITLDLSQGDGKYTYSIE